MSKSLEIILIAVPALAIIYLLVYMFWWTAKVSIKKFFDIAARLKESSKKYSLDYIHLLKEQMPMTATYRALGMIVLFIISILDLDHSFYVILRWFVSPLLIYSAIEMKALNRVNSALLLFILGGIYNPIIVSPLTKNLWVFLNVLAIVSIVFIFFKSSEKLFKHTLIITVFLIIIFFIIRLIQSDASTYGYYTNY